MIIEIKNFGPIGNLKFDIDKDLHLIFGKNAIGKSYATYCIYCLIKSLKSVNTRFLSISRTEFLDTLQKLEVNQTINYTQELYDRIEKSLKEQILSKFQNSLHNTFSSLKNLKNRYTGKNYEIIIHLSDSEKLLIFSDDKGELDLCYDKEGKKHMEIIRKNTKTTKYTLNVNGKKEFGSPTIDEFYLYFSVYIIEEFPSIISDSKLNIRDLYYLPASRSGLYQALSAFAPIIAELTQNRFFLQNKSIELPALSEPLSDYFIDLSTVDKKHVNEDFTDIINFLQNEVLRGEVEYNEETKQIVYKPKDIGLELNLSEASSMVAELAPLVLYFKHILNNKYTHNKIRDRVFSLSTSLFNTSTRRKHRNHYDILFIEEPEAHLHPEIQVKLIEVFAQLTQLNMKVFITTHSNYMFNKINNILIKKEIDEDKVIAYHLVKSSDGSTIEGNMKVTSDGIDDDNFQDVSEQLYNERLEYFENEDQ